MSEIKVLLWNVQDLFLFMDKYKDECLQTMKEPQWQLLSTSLRPNKPIDKIREISSLFLEKDIDLCLLVEVGGRESLDNFNKHFLNNIYEVFHIPSNSDRGIDMGMLIKKEKIKFLHGKIHNSKAFSRGLLEAKIKTPSGKNIVFLLTHLKSKLNMDGKDFEGRSKRALEVNEITRIYNKLALKENIHSIYLTGDFNGILSHANAEQELKALNSKCKLEDIFELLGRDLNTRYTYPYYNKNKELYLMQLDYILTDRKNLKYIGTDSNILEMDGSSLTSFPLTIEERRKLPSDHYPVYMSLKV